MSSQRPKTHFELFGLQPVFELLQADLEERFRRYQAAVHPDRHAGGSDAERRLALHLAANGNEAYRILSDETRRAAYLCELNGAPIDAERNTAMPADFLAGQMAWREAIDEVRDRPEAAAAVELAGRLRHAVREHPDRFLDKSEFSMDWYYPVLGGVVRGEAGRDLIDARHDYLNAAMQVRRMMFYDKLQSELRQVLRRQH